jgi:hypothetical protein
MDTLGQATDGQLTRWDWGNYDKLIQSYTTGLPTTAAGTPKLSIAFGALSGVYDDEFSYMGCGRSECLQEVREAFATENHDLDIWIKRRPQSATFVIAKAELAVEYAWHLRGSGALDTVDPQIRSEFDTVVQDARDFLLKNKAVGQTSPMWYAEMLYLAFVARDLDVGTQQLFQEGVRRYPGFMPLYYAAMVQALPRWGGSTQAVEQVARAAQGTEYDNMAYAFVWYNAVVDCHCQFNGEMQNAARTIASWPDMKRGWEQTAREYPDGWVYNGYAAMACLMGDKKTFRKASALTGPRDAKWEQGWPSGLTYEKCEAQSASK